MDNLNSKKQSNNQTTDYREAYEGSKMEFELKKLQQEIDKGEVEIKNLKEKSEIEILKLKNENAKIEAESIKINLETKELRKPYFFKQFTLETIGKIILGAGVMAFSYSLFLQPYFSAREEDLKRQNSAVEKEKDRLSKLNENIANQKSELEKSNSTLQVAQRALESDLVKKENQKAALDISLKQGNATIGDMRTKIAEQQAQSKIFKNSIDSQKLEIDNYIEKTNLIPEIQKAFLNLINGLNAPKRVIKINSDFANDFIKNGLTILPKVPDSTIILKALELDLDDYLHPLINFYRKLNLDIGVLNDFRYNLTHSYSYKELGFANTNDYNYLPAPSFTEKQLRVNFKISDNILKIFVRENPDADGNRVYKETKFLGTKKKVTKWIQIDFVREINLGGKLIDITKPQIQQMENALVKTVLSLRAK